MTTRNRGVVVVPKVRLGLGLRPIKVTGSNNRDMKGLSWATSRYIGPLCLRNRLKIRILIVGLGICSCRGVSV